MAITVLVGNPSTPSRTTQVAEAVAARVAEISGQQPGATIELADVASRLFDWSDEGVAELGRRVAEPGIVVVASPTYKAAYTGLLKAFLDRYDAGALAGVTAIPVMTGGSMAHSLAPDMTLRPLLAELGACVPTTALYFVTGQLDELDAIVAGWAERNRAALSGR